MRTWYIVYMMRERERGRMYILLILLLTFHALLLTRAGTILHKSSLYTLSLFLFHSPHNKKIGIDHVSKCPSGLCERPETLSSHPRRPPPAFPKKLPSWPSDFSWSENLNHRKFDCISVGKGYWCQRRNTVWSGWSTESSSRSVRISPSLSLYISASSPLSSSIKYVDLSKSPPPDDQYQNSCIPWEKSSKMYLCAKSTNIPSVGCDVGHTRSCFCYRSSSKNKIVEGTQTCNVMNSQHTIYENGILRTSQWSSCICPRDEEKIKVDKRSIAQSNFVILLFWFVLLVVTVVLLYVQLLNCADSVSSRLRGVSTRRKGYKKVRTVSDEEEEEEKRRKSRRRRHRRVAGRKKKTQSGGDYIAVDLVDDDEFHDGL